MIRNFVTGILWGGVLAMGGLAVVSQMTMPDKTPAEPVADAPKAEPVESETAAAPESASSALVAAPDVPATSAEAPQGLAKAPDETDEPLLRPMAEAEAPPPAAVVPDMQAPVIVAEAPKAEAAPEAAPEAATEEVKPADAAPQEVPATEVAQEPVSEAVPEAGGPAASDPVAKEQPEPAEEPAAEAALAETAEPAPATLKLDSGLGEKAVEGVTTGRLPSIEAPDSAPAAGAAEAPAPAADLPPIKRFARSFENPEGKPLFAILLIDPGTAEVRRAELAALPFPVSFVLDPLAPGTAEAAAIYRAAGQEVVMLATGIPKGAKASDLEQSFAGLEGALPEAVALIDTADATFQDDRSLAAEVVTHLAAQGRGLVTFDRGLNAADQVARREALPTATIFRSLDQEGEDAPLIRRYLDRAAFKAAQEGKVVVIGTARQSTIAALMEWTIEGRASSVVLAPITAIMSVE